MGAQKSKSSDAASQQQVSEARVQRLLEAQRKEYERKRKEEAYIAAEQTKSQNEIIIAAQRELQKEALRIAAQRKLQEEAFLIAQRKLQEKAATLAAQRKLEEEAYIAAQRKLHEEAAKTATESKLQEKVLIVAQSKHQEGNKRKLQEEATNTNLQEEAAKRALQEEAAKRALQEEAAKRALQEEAAKRKLKEDSAKRKLLEDAAKRKLQEDASKRKQHEEAIKRREEEDAKKKQEEKAAATRHLPPPFPVPRQGSLPGSVSRPNELNRKADVLRYCSTCYTRSNMKMFECEDGHGSCNDCKIEERACGICRSNITNRRSYDIDNPGGQTKAPCPHAWQGCVLHKKIADMENHVKVCSFKEQACPLTAVFGNCRWFGEISELTSHFTDKHPNYLLTKLGSELHLRSIHRDQRYIRLVVLGHHFIFHQKISKHDGKIYMAVQLIGSKISARKWLYEIHVYNKNEDSRKYMYTDNCRSSIDDMDDVFRSGECAVLPKGYANTFFTKELTYKFFIYENCKGFEFDRNQCA